MEIVDNNNLLVNKTLVNERLYRATTKFMLRNVSPVYLIIFGTVCLSVAFSYGRINMIFWWIMAIGVSIAACLAVVMVVSIILTIYLYYFRPLRYYRKNKSKLVLPIEYTFYDNYFVAHNVITDQKQKNDYAFIKETYETNDYFFIFTARGFHPINKEGFTIGSAVNLGTTLAEKLGRRYKKTD